MADKRSRIDKTLDKIESLEGQLKLPDFFPTLDYCGFVNNLTIKSGDRWGCLMDCHGEEKRVAKINLQLFESYTHRVLRTLIKFSGHSPEESVWLQQVLCGRCIRYSASELVIVMYESMLRQQKSSA